MIKHGMFFILFIFLIFQGEYNLVAQTTALSYDRLIEKSLYFRNRDNDSVNHYAYLAFLEAKRKSDYEHELDALEILIRTNLKISNFTEAQNYCDLAGVIVDKHQLNHRQAEVLINSGNVYQVIGLTDEAIKKFFEAKEKLSFSRKVQDETYLYYLIAVSYYDIGEAEKAIEYGRLSIATAKKDGLIDDLFPPYFLMSNSFANLDSIQKYLSLTEDLLSDFPNLHFERVVFLNNQALINKAIGHLPQSKAQYIEAIGIAQANEYRSYLSTLLNNYAYQLMAENKYDSAGIVLKQAIVIARELHDNDLMSTIFDSYSDYYSNIGNYKMALIYKDSSIVQQDIYRNQQHIQESLFLSALFESEQKEKELFQKQIEINRLWVIALGFLTFFIGALGLGFYLKQKLSLSKSKLESVEKGKALELADALITGQDAERKRLAMDLHDGAIANMGALRFMVDGFFKNHEKYQVFVDSIMSVIRQLREVSHRMLPVGLHDHGLETTIQNLAESVNLSGKYQVSLNISLTSPLSEKMEINLYYLINELINNATKHSKGNAIYVQLMEHKKSLTLSVEDNGGGFDQTVSTDGLGLRNIKSRVEYLGGKIEIISDDSSTIFLIEIPI